MRRSAKIKSYSRAHRPYDVRKDIKPEQLAGIGAVSIGFNDIEAIINAVLPIFLDTPFSLWTELTSRIFGIEGKCQLIKLGIRRHSGDGRRWSIAEANTLCDSVGIVDEVRKYRDAVMHARILDPNAIIAPTQAKKGSEFEVLVSTEALNWLNDLIGVIRHEISTVLHLIHRHHLLEDHRQARPRTILSDATGALSDPETEWLEQEIRGLFDRLRTLQKRRQSLPPPPKFPEEPPAPAASRI